MAADIASCLVALAMVASTLVGKILTVRLLRLQKSEIASVQALLGQSMSRLREAQAQQLIATTKKQTLERQVAKLARALRVHRKALKELADDGVRRSRKSDLFLREETLAPTHLQVLETASCGLQR